MALASIVRVYFVIDVHSVDIDVGFTSITELNAPESAIAAAVKHAKESGVRIFWFTLNQRDTLLVLYYF